MAMFVVTKQDGTVIELPDPKTATPSREPLHSEESGRNQKGRMFLYKVATKRKWTNTWGPLTPEQISLILSAIDDDEYAWFYLTFTDPKTNKEVTGEFYAGPQSSSILWWHPTNSNKRKYSNLNVNFIEL